MTMTVIIYYKKVKIVKNHVMGIKEFRANDTDMISIMFDDNVSYFPAYKDGIKKIKIKMEN